MAKDYLGNEIRVGDEVVYIQLNYRDFKKGIITKITEKMCFIKQGKLNIGSHTECRQYHNQVIKICTTNK